MFREMKKKNPHTININYTLEKEISMKKMEFLFKRVLFIYLFIFLHALLTLTRLHKHFTY